MNLDQAGVEFAKFDVTADFPLAQPPQVSFNGGPFGPAEWDDGTSTSLARTGRVLVRGPLSPVTAGAVLLDVGRHRLRVLITGPAPEQVIRPLPDTITVR